MAEELTTISVQDYISTVLPEQLAAQNGAGDATYAVQYDVAGTQYGVKYSGGQSEVVQGGVENPLVSIAMDESAWRSMITNDTASADALVSPAKMTASRLEKLLATKGKFNLELTKEDGSVINSTTVFNSVETPEVTLMMKADDYAKILKGELNSQMAFMTGKLKFKGDMNFLMKLGGLM
ncbi:MAG TPA: SCP2 sterol-binding domain-containing protein [Herpetosiphonaceae bacterium]|nr:SCP2 sterol-binding domain-containing protein [Herpetosiphonaceae bacterium]